MHNRSSSTIHAWSTFTCPLLCQQSPSGFSTTRLDTGVPRGNSTAALPTRLAATTPILPPPTVPTSPQFAAANCHSATPVPAFIATNPSATTTLTTQTPLKPQVVDC